jgi:hypothetical protein
MKNRKRCYFESVSARTVKTDARMGMSLKRESTVLLRRRHPIRLLTDVFIFWQKQTKNQIRLKLKAKIIYRKKHQDD